MKKSDCQKNIVIYCYIYFFICDGQIFFKHHHFHHYFSTFLCKVSNKILCFLFIIFVNFGLFSFSSNIIILFQFHIHRTHILHITLISPCCIFVCWLKIISLVKITHFCFFCTFQNTTPLWTKINGTSIVSRNKDIIK